MKKDYAFDYPIERQKFMYNNPKLSGDCCEIHLLTKVVKVEDYYVGGYYCFMTFIGDEENASSVILSSFDNPKFGDTVLLNKDMYVDKDIDEDTFVDTLYEQASMRIENLVTNYVSFSGQPTDLVSTYPFIVDMSKSLEKDVEDLVNGLLNKEIYENNFLHKTFEDMPFLNRLCSKEFDFELKDLVYRANLCLENEDARNEGDTEIIGF